MQKLYCYVDETGQDTEGKFFLVSIVVAGNERDELDNFLLEIEETTGKRQNKWRKSDFETRKAYLLEVFSNPLFKGKLFFGKYEGKSYIDLTILATAQAIFARTEENYKATVIVDGLSKTDVFKFSAGSRRLKVKN